LAEIVGAAREEEYVRDYAERSKPVFGIGGPNDAGPRCNHFALVEYALRELPAELGETMARFLNAIHLPHVEVMIRRTFRRIITPLRMSFIVGLLRYRHTRLKILAEGPIK
jgi:hypothetical protein